MKKVSIVGIFILLYLTLIFRADSVSPDQENYRIIFEQYVFPSEVRFEDIWYSHIDFLYGIFNGVIKYVGLEYRYFIYFYSLLNLSVLFFGFNKICKKLDVSLIWTITFYYSHLFLYREMLQVRAGLAYATCLAALYFLFVKQRILFYLLVLVAAMIHKSAAIFLLVPLWLFFLERVGLVLALTIALILLVSINYFIPIYAQIILGDVAAYAYILSDKSHFIGGGGVFNPTLLKYIFLSVALYLYIKNNSSKEWEVILGIYSISAILLISLSKYHVLASRVASLFAIVEPLIVAKLLSIWVSGQKNMAYKSFYIFLGFLLGLLLLALNIDVKSVVNDYRFSLK